MVQLRKRKKPNRSLGGQTTTKTNRFWLELMPWKCPRNFSSNWGPLYIKGETTRITIWKCQEIKFLSWKDHLLVKNPQKVGYSLVVLKEPKYCGYGHKKVWKKNWPTKWPHVGQGGVDRATISSGPMSWKWHSKVVNFPVVCKHPWAVPMELKCCAKLQSR